MITSALIALLAIAGPAAAQAGPVYNLDNVCATLKTGSNYVYRGSTGYNFGTNVANASRFRFDATGLSRYSLRDHADQFAYQSVAAFILHGNTFGPESDWTITATSSGKYTLVSTKSGQKMGNLLGSLGSVSTAAEFEITTGATGCVAIRDIDPGVTTLGGPGVGNGKLLGWIDAHAHITAAAAFGGQIHCGEAFSPGGVEVAQAGCASHGTLGIGAILEAVIGGTDSGNSPEDGWPTFNDWPKPNTLLHEQSYYRGIERSWRSGLRVLNALYVANQWLCNLFPSRDTACDETTQINAQNVYIQDMEKYIDAQSGGPGQGWFRIARTPAEVRTIAAAGKLAVVLGVESSELFGCSANPNATCTTAIINSGLDALQAMGVHGLYPVHKFDNAFGGTRFDEGNVGAAVNIGNQLSTGSWWSAVSCPTGPHDNHPPNSDLVNALVALGIFGNPGTPPNYPDGPVCNTRGLTTLGTHLINEMIRRGMVIHIDHMSVKTAQATLALAEAANYPGVVSVHSWSDPLIVDRILALGGFVAGYAHVATTPSDNPNDSAGTSFIDEWRLNKGLPHGANITGYGAGSDVNGLGLLPGPQVSPPAGPLQYPFTAPNGAVFNKQVFGNHTWDYNTEGVAQYGLYADWITDLVRQAGTDGALLKQHLWNGAEAYTKMWENARA